MGDVSVSLFCKLQLLFLEYFSADIYHTCAVLRWICFLLVTDFCESIARLILFKINFVSFCCLFIPYSFFPSLPTPLFFSSSILPAYASVKSSAVFFFLQILLLLFVFLSYLFLVYVLSFLPACQFFSVFSFWFVSLLVCIPSFLRHFGKRSSVIMSYSFVWGGN